MKKIVILTTYFGIFNNYFLLWLNSVEKNESIEFVLITDNEVKQVPRNMNVIKMKFTDIQKKITDFFPFPVVCDTGYKMSEYQVIFGMLFSDLINEYDFWGYCETDLILGNLRNFLTEEKLDRYDKIYYLGHLTLYRNIDALNRIALLDHDWPTATYKQAYTCLLYTSITMDISSIAFME